MASSERSASPTATADATLATAKRNPAGQLACGRRPLSPKTARMSASP